MSFDYSSLFKGEVNTIPTWQDYYEDSLTVPENFLNLLQQAVFLPYDHYKIITAYAFIPSALARVVPYLFLHGVSGSGKSTIGKLISYLHGIKITSSDDTFAAIRNSINQRKTALVNIPTDNPAFPDGVYKEVEANTHMVWDDIGVDTFTSKGDIYRLFKFGYDKSCDTIEVSSITTGENLTFRCFCPKTFSSISPLHTNENLKELRRRLLVIPTKRIEDLSQSRLEEMGIDNDRWENKILDISSLDWKGFDELFKQYWNLTKAQEYITNRVQIARNVKGLKSHQKAIAIDLITTGITIGIWADKNEALDQLKDYWLWLDSEIRLGESLLTQLLKELVETEQQNCLAGGIDFAISNQQIKVQIEMAVGQGLLLEKPSTKAIKQVLEELGMRLISGGKWIKS